MDQKRNAYVILVEITELKRPLGWPRRRWEDNSKMYLKEVGCDARKWMDIAEDRDQ